MGKYIDIMDDCQSKWFGMNDYTINLKTSRHTVELKYIGEPPHGDSYHRMFIDGELMEGYVWGCNFLFPFNQEFIICSWMENLFERKTAVYNLKDMTFHVLKKYWFDYRVIDNKLQITNNDFIDYESVNYEEFNNSIY